MNDSRKHFRYNPAVRYATDVCFQQSQRPSGSMVEARPCYSGKHKLHGFKFEASVLPNRYCISCSNNARGGHSNLEIMQSRKDVHRYATTKRVDEDYLEDNGRLCARLVGKGY